ncbi:MAG: Hpt domain-containing protein [Magnetococcales bacterium]|nr:Hpt domain-containing protein [Magnetococcales bacterium]MBF0438511.1 Hpt domain-containing protein [Magnetococcales bacterium]
MSLSNNAIPPFDGGTKIRLLHDSVGGHVKEIVQKFLDTLSARMQRFSNAYATHDLPTLYNEAHKLKGAAATFGAVYMAHLCAQMEQQCKMNILPPVELLDALETNAQFVTEAMTLAMENLE